jgi:hypothetical protein
VTELQAAWDAAVANCLNGHDNCSYGGMTPWTGYWLRDEACEQPHGDRCAWCGAEAETGFVGHAPGGWDIFQVPACQPCADAWVLERPEWHRRGEPVDAPRRTADEVFAEADAERERTLAQMNPIAREAWEAAERAATNMLLWGNPDGPAPGEKPNFTGIESIFGLDQAVKLVPYGGTKPLGPARQRYNPDTKKWETDRG